MKLSMILESPRRRRGHIKARLTWPQIEHIIQSKLSNRDISNEVGVSIPTVVKYKNWWKDAKKIQPMLDQGYSVYDIANATSIPLNLLRKWKQPNNDLVRIASIEA